MRRATGTVASVAPTEEERAVKPFGGDAVARGASKRVAREGAAHLDGGVEGGDGIFDAFAHQRTPRRAAALDAHRRCFIASDRLGRRVRVLRHVL